MTRWTLALGAVLVLGAIVSVAVARALGWSQVSRGRDRGLTVFVAGQILWLVVVMARNGLLIP